MNDLFITGGTVVSDGKQKTLDILIKDGRIEKIAPSMNVPEKAEVIEAVGKWILPGLIDDQVHFREPGLTHKATIATESRAAVAGGVTTYFEMPNVSPPPSTWKDWKKSGRLEQGILWQIMHSFWGQVMKIWRR